MGTIILTTVIASCIVSALFVMIRVYFCYFVKRNCSDSCCCEAAKDARLVEMYCNKEEVAPANAPKRSRKPKQEAENLGDFALKAADKIEKRRKKKS